MRNQNIRVQSHIASYLSCKRSLAWMSPYSLDAAKELSNIENNFKRFWNSALPLNSKLYFDIEDELLLN